jgi:hypothetical protein
MGIFRRAWGRGIGAGLLRAFEEWARSNGLWRLELTVMAHNDRAIRLYEKAGFVREGTKRQAIIVDGRPIDERVMARCFDLHATRPTCRRNPNGERRRSAFRRAFELNGFVRPPNGGLERIRVLPLERITDAYDSSDDDPTIEIRAPCLPRAVWVRCSR